MATPEDVSRKEEWEKLPSEKEIAEIIEDMKTIVADEKKVVDEGKAIADDAKTIAEDGKIIAEDVKIIADDARTIVHDVKEIVKDVEYIEAGAEVVAECIEISKRNPSHITELPHLPHEAIVGSGAAAHLGAAVNSLNKVTGPLSVAAGVATTGYAAYEDYEYGTTRNTVETIATIGGGILAGHGGAVGGAALGTALFPGVGTVIGGVVGAIGVGLSGAFTTSYVAKAIGDSYGYNILEKNCTACGKRFRVRRYRGQTDFDLCDECWTRKNGEAAAEEKKDEASGDAETTETEKKENIETEVKEKDGACDADAKEAKEKKDIEANEDVGGEERKGE